MIAQQQGGRIAVIAVGRFQQQREAADAELVLEAATDWATGHERRVTVVCTHAGQWWELR